MISALTGSEDPGEVAVMAKQASEVKYFKSAGPAVLRDQGAISSQIFGSY